ncbi:LemA family protein [bacterium]|jgi:LemA protein|nr:LemA family protein [bacterium]
MEYIIGFIIVVLVFGFIIGFNKIVALKEAANTDKEGINIQLDERNKLFDSLINTVKKYTEHENEVFTKITELRSKASQGDASSDSESHQAQEDLSKLISSGQLAQGFNLSVEAYPDLKSSNNFLQLQESIENIERKLANSKKAFNMSIEDYNSYVEGIPGLFIIMLVPSLKISFIRWTLATEEAQKAEKKVVSF